MTNEEKIAYARKHLDIELCDTTGKGLIGLLKEVESARKAQLAIVRELLWLRTSGVLIDMEVEIKKSLERFEKTWLVLGEADVLRDKEHLLSTLRHFAAPNWTSPHETQDLCELNTGVSLEWWCGTHKLTIDAFNADGPFEYTKVWGPNIDTEMETGVLRFTQDARDLWVWLNSVKP